MKTIIIAVLAVILSMLANPIQTKAQSILTYSKLTNEQIGITPINAIGQNYEIRSAKGKIVMKGKITSSNTFYISITNLAFGSYAFSINGETLQQFNIK